METIRLLIVEDNPVDVLSLKESLQQAKGANFAISHVETLAEAKGFLEKEDINVVVLDLGLPDSQGLETFLEVQKSAPNVPIVVVSGLDDESLAIETVKNGAQDYLIKDKWDAELILRALHYAIQRHQLLFTCKQANESSLRANRALRVLSLCNQLLVRATEEKRFLEEICRILVDDGEYRMAWVGFALHNEARTVQPVAIAGFEDGYLQAVKITWSDDETGRGPTGTAIRTGITKINRSSWSNPEYAPWRSEALKRGYASSIALPLTDHKGIFGALTMYSKEPDAFDDEEVRLLSQLADDLSYGISTLRMRAAKEKSDLARQESERRFRAMFEGAQDYIFLQGRSFRFTLVNPAVENLFGIPASKIVGMRYEDLFGEEGAASVRESETRVLQGESIEEEHTRRVNGMPMTFLETRIPLRDDAGDIVGIFTVSRDVTERKRIEFSPSESDAACSSEAMRLTLRLARAAAQKDSTILLLGESGSGKDYLAKYIHNSSKRANGPYFSVNCAAITSHLAESELFGHEKGSFTGAQGRKRGLLELAEGGTLLFNEVGELSLPLQAKLLTFLDTKKFTRVGGEKEIFVNARLIAATNRNLEKAVEAEDFRKDLFYRINVLSIPVPPLRDRREDIPMLVHEILSELQTQMQFATPPKIDAATMEMLKKYNWPGNVRELRNILERGVMLSDTGAIDLKHLQLGTGMGSPNNEWSFTTSFPFGGTLQDVTDELTKSMLEEALRISNGNKRKAAQTLGIARDSLYRYMKKFGMERGD
ncbi:MAG: sigma 54-interacting transcriptional regulator [Desulfomonilaceae bacterium]